jgi:hypothetical protein
VLPAASVTVHLTPLTLLLLLLLPLPGQELHGQVCDGRPADLH